MVNSNPLISVVVTTYNRKELLTETLNSILNQTYTNFELIVVDNYSDYDFFSHIEFFDDPRIKAYQNQNDGIIAINRNFGIKKSVGEYIAFCDDDDVWMPNKLEMSLTFIIESKCLILFTDRYIIGQNGDLVSDKSSSLINIFEKRRIYKLKSSLLIFNNPICLSSVIINRRALNNYRFSENKNLIASEDYFLWLELNREFPIFYLSEKLIKYRIHTNSISNNSKQRLKLNLYVNHFLKKSKKYKNSILFFSFIFSYMKYYYRNIRAKLRTISL